MDLPQHTQDTRKPLTGRTSLVTGAAKRIGRHVALGLARAGANVIVHYGSAEVEAKEVADTIRASGVDAWTVQADLDDPQQAEALVDRSAEQAGPIDVLINNASIFPEGRLADCSAQDILANARINAVAPFLIARAVARQGRQAAIVNFLDARMVDHDPLHVPYNLSKRMLLSLTKMMALEFAPRVRVNAVAPGVILAPVGKDEESYLAKLVTSNSLQRIGTVDQVLDAVMFLLQNEFITGQVLYVDGGRHMKGSVYGG